MRKTFKIPYVLTYERVGTISGLEAFGFVVYGRVGKLVYLFGFNFDFNKKVKK